MIKGDFRNVLVLVGSILALSLGFATTPLAGQNAGTGHIVGFVYADDGTTPFEGAVVKFKNLASGAVYESTRSDTLGVFKVQGVETGLYSYGVMTDDGDFNADNIVGLRIAGNEIAKLSIALDPYGKDVASAVGEVFNDRSPNGEVLVGTIADFDSGSGMAQVQMVKGLLRVKDRIHAKGKATDFYQEVGDLTVGQNAARQILSGQTGGLKLERGAQKGDLVYVVRDRRVFPFFLAPAGVAAVIAGNSVITYGVVRIKDEGEPVSAIRD